MELIDREILLEKLRDMRFRITEHRGGYQYLREYEKEKYESIERMEDMIRDEPVIDDVALVKRGKWIPANYRPYLYAQCSYCGKRIMAQERSNYCPCCGANMVE